MVKVWSDLKIKRIKPLVGAVAAVGAAAPAAMGASVLGPAQGYSAFVFGNMTASSDTWGSVAVGGNATYTSGYNIQAATAGGNALVVGGNFTQKSSSINGNVVVGGTACYNNPTINGSLTAQNVGLAGGGSVSGGVKYYESYNPAISYIGGAKQSGSLTLPVNFSAAQTALTGHSNSLANSGPAQGASAQYGTLTLKGSSSALDVFDVTAALLSSVNTIDLVVTGSPTVVVNVNGRAATIAGGTSGFHASPDRLMVRSWLKIIAAAARLMPDSLPEQSPRAGRCPRRLPGGCCFAAAWDWVGWRFAGTRPPINVWTDNPSPDHADKHIAD